MTVCEHVRTHMIFSHENLYDPGAAPIRWVFLYPKRNSSSSLQVSWRQSKSNAIRCTGVLGKDMQKDKQAKDKQNKTQQIQPKRR